MAGVGKTALAVHAAHLLCGRYPDAQLYVNLRGYLSDQAPMRSDEALEVLLIALGIPLDRIPPSPDARAAMWRGQVSRRRAVVVLDNAADAEQVRPLLPGSGSSLVIITSRRRLNLPDVRPLSLAALPPGDAVALFVAIVGKNRTASRPRAVEAVVARCGYLPLAIEVAAAWLAHRPTKLVEDLFAALGSPPDAVTAALTLSYRDLDPTVQRVFRSLGRHPGPDITVEVAAALADADATAARHALDVLYEHNLLQEPSRGRYQFHDLVREFTRTLAGSTGDGDLRRLLRAYLDSAASADLLLGPGVPGCVGPNAGPADPADPAGLGTDIEARAWFTTELANLLACARLAIDQEITPYAWLLPSAMSTFFRDLGYALQARPLLIGALRVATSAGALLGQANCHLGLGTLDQLAGNQTAARSHLEQAISAYQRLGNRLGEANALMGLGVLDQIGGDYGSAQERYHAALAHYQELGNTSGRAYAHAELGAVAQLASRYAEALAHTNQALALYTEAGSHTGQAEAYTNLGGLSRFTGDHDAALAYLSRALDLHTALGEGRGRAYALVQLGAVHRATGNHVNARDALHRALTGYHDAGDRIGMAFAHSQLGMLERVLTDYPPARIHFEQALSLYRGAGSLAGQANTLNSLGVLERLMGDRIAALSNLNQALAAYTELNDRNGQADVHTELADVERDTGDLAAARTHLTTALALWTELGNTGAADAVRRSLAELADGPDQATPNPAGANL
jgi:tetratricopeptide (TPR) repeat protein